MRYLLLISFTIIGFLSNLEAQNNILSSNPTPLAFKNYSYNNHTAKYILKVFKYDNNEISNGLGVRTQAYELGTFIEIPDTSLIDFIGQKIDLVKYGIDDNTIISNAEIQIFEDSLSSTPSFTQNIETNSIVRGWNQVILENGYLIKGKSIFIGISIATSEGGYTQTYDTDPASFPELSGHTVLNGSYVGTLSNEVGFDADYNIQAIITDGHGNQYIDLTIKSITPSTKGCALSSEEILRAVLINQGEDSVYTEFDLTVSINNMELMQQVSPTTFYPNVEKIVNLPAADLSQLMQYQINAFLDYSDAVPENNSFKTTINTGNSKLKINLHTDDYPEELSWVLFDKNNNIIQKNSKLEAYTLHTDEICLIDTNCYTWLLNDSNNDGIALPDTITAFELFYNDSNIVNSNENEIFLSSYYKYGIASGCLMNDITLKSIQIPFYESPQNIAIKGTLLNNGINTLNSFTLKYAIDDSISNVDTIKNISINTGNTYNFEHSVPFNFNEQKEYSVQLMVDMPNELNDEFASDNQLLQKTVINENVLEKQQLIEHFTSSTNDDCFYFTPNIDELLGNNPYSYSLIRYQANFPGNGDPYFIEETAERIKYYNVSALPSVFVNSNFENDFDQDKFDTYKNNKTIIELSANANYINTSVEVSVDVETVIETDTNYYIYIAILENTTFNNVGTNGQTEFNNVLLRLLPNEAGFNLPELNANETYNYSITTDLSTSFMEEINDLSAVIFIQNRKTKQVLQSKTIEVLPAVNIKNKTENQVINIYPNPFNSELQIKNIGAQALIVITDIAGKEIDRLSTKTNSIKINSNLYDKGIYIVHIYNSNYELIKTQKIIKH